MSGKTIQTEIDNLVSLVQEQERISVKDAAKRLNLPEETISEWAGFLEEEGIINIEYKLTKPFLVKKKLTSEQLNDLKSEVKEEKSIFDRKSQTTLNYLNKLETEVDSLKDMFNDLGNHFNKRLSGVKGELKKLKNMEDEKEKLNKQIIDSKQKFMKQVGDINKKLYTEEKNYKDIYDVLCSQSKMGSKILDIQEDEMEFIKKTDKMLSRKLKSIRKKLDRKKKPKRSKGSGKKKLTKETESELKSLEKKYAGIKESLYKEKDMMDSLIQENKKQEEELNKLNKDVLEKVKKSGSEINTKLEEVEEIPKKFKDFIKKKDKTLKMLDKISYNEGMLKNKLEDLIKKGSALDLTEDPDKVMDEIRNLEEELNNLSKKKSLFEKEIKKIFKLLHLK